jgi:hypoxanthine phosphoribosyltransferase
MSLDQASLFLHDQKFVKWIDKSEINEVLEQMAFTINKDYEGKSPVIIGVLDGVIMVFAGLTQKLTFNLTIELIKLKSYEGQKSTGSVKMLLPLSAEIKNLDVIVVEDIVDTGQTLAFLLEELKKHEPKSIEVATFLLKGDVFQGKFPIKYVGKKIENKFAVGFGMDFDGLGRQLPDIYIAASTIK